jgi:hypothetical protein
MGNSLVHTEKPTHVPRTSFGLEFVLKYREEGKYLRIARWCFVLGQPTNDGSDVTGRQLYK